MAILLFAGAILWLRIDASKPIALESGHSDAE
jgi:hypothetical protein